MNGQQGEPGSSGVGSGSLSDAALAEPKPTMSTPSERAKQAALLEHLEHKRPNPHPVGYHVQQAIDAALAEQQPSATTPDVEQIVREAAKKFVAVFHEIPLRDDDELESVMFSHFARVATQAREQAREPLMKAIEELTGELADALAHQCDFHEINASKWWKAVKRARKLLNPCRTGEK